MKVEAREAIPSQPNQLQRHYCTGSRYRFGLQLLISSLAVSALGIPWPSDVFTCYTMPTHCVDRRTLTCMWAVRLKPPTSPIPPAYGLAKRKLLCTYQLLLRVHVRVGVLSFNSIGYFSTTVKYFCPYM